MFRKRRLTAAGVALALGFWFVVPPAQGAVIKGPAAAIYVRSLRHNGTLYIPVAVILRAYGLNLLTIDDSWYVFASDQCRLELKPGSAEARLNGAIIRMDGTADWVDGKLMVPIYLAIQTLSSRYPAGEAAVPVPTAKTVRVVLDPGHGGIDSGAVAPDGTEEKEIVMEITKKVKSLLESRGFDVMVTRTSDVFVPLRKRARLASRFGADIFVSIHANAAVNRLAEGVETFYYASSSDFISQKIAALENAVLNLESGLGSGGGEPAGGNGNGEGHSERIRRSVRLAQNIQNLLVAATEGPDRGVKGAEFYVLKHATVPSVLVETGFLSNHLEKNLLGSDGYQDKVAAAIARGIEKYLNRERGNHEITRIPVK